MRKLQFCSLILYLFILLSCDDVVPIQPSNKMVLSTHSVKEFHSFSLESGFIAEIVSDSLSSLSIEADYSYMPYVEVIETNDGELIVRRRDGIAFKDNRLVKIYLSVDQLNRLRVSGGANVTVDSLSSQGNVSLVLSGGSKAKVMNCCAKNFHLSASGGSIVNVESGDVDQFAFDLSGGSDLRAYPMACNSVEALLSGGSKAYVSVANSVSVTASGGSQFNYQGSPIFNQTILTGGSIVNRN